MTGPPVPRPDEDLTALPILLTECGYHPDALADALGAPSGPDLIGRTAFYSFVTEADDPALIGAPAGILAGLFLLNRGLPTTTVTRTLPPALRDALTRLGLIRDVGGRYRATLSLTPHAGRFFLSDRIFHGAGPGDVRPRDEPWLVMPPHASSLSTLGAMLIPAGDVLDIGCGCGFLMLAAPAPERARRTGIDSNDRATLIAHANGLLNRRDADFRPADARTFRSPHPLAPTHLDHRVALVDDPHLTLTRRQIARGTADGHTSLAYGPERVRALLAALRRRGVAEVVPAAIYLHAPARWAT